jgi:hypothetical protein
MSPMADAAGSIQEQCRPSREAFKHRQHRPGHDGSAVTQLRGVGSDRHGDAHPPLTRRNTNNPAPSGQGAARSTPAAAAHTARQPEPANISSRPRQLTAALTTTHDNTQVVNPHG